LESKILIKIIVIIIPSSEKERREKPIELLLLDIYSSTSSNWLMMSSVKHSSTYLVTIIPTNIKERKRNKKASCEIRGIKKQ